MGIFSKSNKWSETDYNNARRQMVERQLAGRDVTDKNVLDVMGRVPRHLFVPEDLRHDAYDDCPLPIGSGQTISQPYIVASMTEYLRPDKGKKVLEVGTGSGYQTAVLSELFGQVVTVEYYPELSHLAQQVLNRLGFTNIKYHTGDILLLPFEREVFDAIMVTAAPEEIPQRLIDLLMPEGRMVIPVGAGIQDLKLVMKGEDDRLEIKSLYPVRFVPLQH